MSFRKQQIESTLKKAIGTVLSRGVADPRVSGLISVTRLDVADDNRNATIYITVLPEAHEKTTLAGLNSAAPFIFQQVCKAVTFRTVPHLRFKLDLQHKKQTAVLDAIRQGIAREKPAATEADAPQPPDREE